MKKIIVILLFSTVFVAFSQKETNTESDGFKDDIKKNTFQKKAKSVNDSVIINNVIITKNSKHKALSARESDLNGILNFDLNKSNLKSKSTYNLDKAVLLMIVDSSYAIHFESHTDARGPSKYGLQLSQRRVDFLKNYILSKGFSEDRVTGKGYGDSKPLNRCIKNVRCTTLEYLKNKRTTFSLRKIGAPKKEKTNSNPQTVVEKENIDSKQTNKTEVNKIEK